jgi:hypothetical protein
MENDNQCKKKEARDRENQGSDASDDTTRRSSGFETQNESHDEQACINADSK